MSQSKSEEIDRNLDRLSEILHELMPTHRGEYALGNDTLDIPIVGG